MSRITPLNADAVLPAMQGGGSPSTRGARPQHLPSAKGGEASADCKDAQHIRTTDKGKGKGPRSAGAGHGSHAPITRRRDGHVVPGSPQSHPYYSPQAAPPWPTSASKGTRPNGHAPITRRPDQARADPIKDAMARAPQQSSQQYSQSSLQLPSSTPSPVTLVGVSPVSPEKISTRTSTGPDYAYPQAAAEPPSFRYTNDDEVVGPPLADGKSSLGHQPLSVDPPRPVNLKCLHRARFFPGFEMCFDIGSRHLGCWGQNTSPHAQGCGLS